MSCHIMSALDAFGTFFTDTNARPFSCACMGPTPDNRLIIRDALVNLFLTCPDPLPVYDSKKNRPFVSLFDMPKYESCTCAIDFVGLQKRLLEIIDRYVILMPKPRIMCTCQEEFGHNGGGPLSGKPFTKWCKGCFLIYQKESVANSLVYLLLKFTGTFDSQ